MPEIGNLPAGSLLGLVGVVIGSLLSIFGVWLSNRASLKQLNIRLTHEQRLKAREIEREKLEELYIRLGNWLATLAGHYLSISRVMKDEITYNQYLDLCIESGGKQSFDFNRIEMIIDVYGDRLREKFDHVIEARNELNEIQNEFRKDYERGLKNGKNFLNRYFAAQRKIEERGRNLKISVAHFARES